MSLIQINGVHNRSMFEHNKTLGISYAQHVFLKQGPFSTVVHTILWEFSLSDSEKKLSLFSISFCSYLIGSFQTFWNKFYPTVLLRHWSSFQAFPYLHIKAAGGAIWKQSTYIFQWWLETSLKVECLHITVAVGAPLKAKDLYIPIVLGAFLKAMYCTYTLQLLFWAPLKAEY